MAHEARAETVFSGSLNLGTIVFQENNKIIFLELISKCWKMLLRQYIP
jgi:hypothetical protein